MGKRMYTVQGKGHLLQPKRNETLVSVSIVGRAAPSPMDERCRTSLPDRRLFRTHAGQFAILLLSAKSVLVDN